MTSPPTSDPAAAAPQAGKRRRRTPEVAEREILDAAGAFLVDHEFRDLSVEALMTATGMGRSTFYHYFPDRAAVVLRMLDEAQAELLVGAVAWLEDRSPDARAELRSAIEDSARAWLRHWRLLRAVQQGAGQDDRVEQRFQAMLDEWSTAIAARLRAEQDRGLVIPDPDELAWALVQMNVNVFATRLGRDPAVTPAAVADVLWHVWVAALYPTSSIPARNR